VNHPLAGLLVATNSVLKASVGAFWQKAHNAVSASADVSWRCRPLNYIAERKFSIVFHHPEVALGLEMTSATAKYYPMSQVIGADDLALSSAQASASGVFFFCEGIDFRCSQLRSGLSALSLLAQRLRLLRGLGTCGSVAL